MPDINLIKKADLARVREIEFTEMFGYSIKKLMEALGVTRKIAKQAGAALKSYKASGTLLDGAVAEGETIPLSKYKTEPVTYKEITLKKWRKATSAEAIIERGYDQAVGDTTDEMLKDVQKGIRKDFFTFLATGTGAASGNTFQAALPRHGVSCRCCSRMTRSGRDTPSYAVLLYEEGESYSPLPLSMVSCTAATLYSLVVNTVRCAVYFFGRLFYFKGMNVYSLISYFLENSS